MESQKNRQHCEHKYDVLSCLAALLLTTIGFACQANPVEKAKPESPTERQQSKRGPADATASSRTSEDAKSAARKGELSFAEINGVLSAKVMDVSSCMERALGPNWQCCPRFDLQWVILETGAVTDVSVDTRCPKQPKVIDCMVAEISSWKFPKPRGGSVEVSYPLLPHCVGF